jgi:N-methylhydantoinase B
MPVEATEHAGPVVVWRKELREGSGGAGQLRGGLGQEIEVSAAEGYSFRFSAMFDRIQHAARGLEGGQAGAEGYVGLDDGTLLRGKGQQFVPAERRLVLRLPGGGGYGDPRQRDRQQVERDVRFGYISAEQARDDYGFDAAQER